MNEKDGKTNRITITSTSNILNAPNFITPFAQIKEKVHRGEITIKDILDNDNSINDLITNPISPYKEMITTDNIKILIDYCLKFNKEPKETSQSDLRYPYFSSQILCSSCALLFKQSISNIKHSNSLIINKNIINGNEMENKVNNYNFSNEKLEGNQFNNNEYSNKSKKDDDLYDSSNQDYIRDINDGYSSNFLKYYESEIEEKYVDPSKNLTETEIKRTTINNNISIKYNDEDMKIIKEILNHIFGFLNKKKNDEILNENLTYWGYFKNIINYLLINETDIMIEYLFGSSTPIIDEFYSHLNNTSIQIILENLLNILSDKEDKKYNDKYNKIIIKLIQILSEDKNNNNFENAEFICELIINTLVNKSENQLIDLIIKDNSIMIKIKNIIENIDKGKNNEKILTNIIKVLCQINNIILNSLNESSSNKIPDLINYHNKLNIFEYQYFCTKKISYNNIFTAFKENILSYLFISEEIYKLISTDIKDKYEKKKNNQDINNNLNKMNNKDKDKKVFGLHNIYKWKFILSVIKVYVYSYTVTDKLKDDKYFDDKKLFLISIELYFEFPQNNIYQNIFYEIIKLMCLEECPYYLVEPFLIINNEEKQYNFIYDLLKNMKINKDKKYNLTNGFDLAILNLFYSSNNKAIINHFKNSVLDCRYKDTFNKESIKIKFERQLNEDYEYSKDEIFDIERDKDDTFDDNDCEINRDFLCFKNIISNFLDKIEIEKNKPINKIKNENDNNNQSDKKEANKENKIQKNTIDKSTYNIDSAKYSKTEEKTIINSEKKENNGKKGDSKLEMRMNLSLTEEQ